MKCNFFATTNGCFVTIKKNIEASLAHSYIQFTFLAKKPINRNRLKTN